LWRETVYPPILGLTLACTVIAQMIYYIFPRLQVFPRCVLSWVSYYNALFLCYMIWKWSPGSGLHDPWLVDLVPGSIPCKLGLFFDNFTLSGAVACSTLIATTIFIVVVLQKDMENNSRIYYLSYIAFVTLYPLVIGLYTAVGFTNQQVAGQGQSCAVTNNIGKQFLKIPSLIFFGIQFVLISTALLKVKKIMESVHSRSGSNFPMGYLFVRFATSFFAQVISIFPVQIFLIIAAENSNAIFERFAYVIRVIGPLADAIVLVVSNSDFLDWVKLNVAGLRAKKRGTATVTVELALVSTELTHTPVSDDFLVSQDASQDEFAIALEGEGKPRSLTISTATSD